METRIDERLIMKAAVLREFGKPLSLEEVETPQPGADEVLIKVKAAGIDGTHLKLLEGFGYRPELPFIIGHEPARWNRSKWAFKLGLFGGSNTGSTPSVFKISLNARQNLLSRSMIK